MKTIQKVQNEMENIATGYANAGSRIKTTNGASVLFKKYTNKGAFEYSIQTEKINFRLKKFTSYSEFIATIKKYLKRQQKS